VPVFSLQLSRPQCWPILRRGRLRSQSKLVLSLSHAMKQ
jgi:hypothetical protein